MVRTRFDQLAKGILSAILAPAGEVRTQEEIHGEVQAADVLFLPAADRAPARARLGLLGRMADAPCLLEPFHATPGAEQVLDCLCKQLTLRRNLVREARKDPDPAPPEIPRLWILSAGRPETVLPGLGFAPPAGWPTGVWRAPPLLSTYLLVLRDLPETRDTLPLRILGAGATFQRAVAEINALPAEEWEPRAFIPLLLAFRMELPQDQLDEDDMRYVEKLQAIYADWEHRILEQGLEKGLEQGLEKGLEQGLEKGLEQGREQGLEQGLRRALLASYEARFGSVPEAVRAAVEAMDDIETLQRWAGVFATAPASGIAATLGVSNGSSAPAR